VVFVVIASSSVPLPVLAYLGAQNRVRQPLDDLRVWLTQNNSTVMAVLLLVIRVTILGKGIAGILLEDPACGKQRSGA
jgi:Sap, sulfolipid-1-addressing protein